MDVVEISRSELGEWDDFVGSCPGTTFYQTSKFQEHYRGKCERTSYLLFKRGGKLVAGLPGGICREGDGLVLRSPFSASFAGFALRARTGVQACLEVVQALVSWCEREGLQAIEIQQTPDIYGSDNCDEVEYALRRCGFSLRAFEVSHQIPLLNEPESQFEHSARKNYKRGISVGLSVAPSRNIRASYELIAENRARKGGVLSVSFEDLAALMRLFPGRIHAFSVLHEEQEVGAGVFYALSPSCLMAFWWAHRAEAQELRPVNFLAWWVARWAREGGFEAFDLGTTSDGGELNTGLARFKESLGARPFLRRRFRLELRRR